MIGGRTTCWNKFNIDAMCLIREFPLPLDACYELRVFLMQFRDTIMVYKQVTHSCKNYTYSHFYSRKGCSGYGELEWAFEK